VLYTEGWRRWVFSSSLLPSANRSVAVSDGALSAVSKAICGLLDLVFPDECRICGESLHQISRIPVCGACLSKPERLTAEFYCVTCRAPFLNRAPLDADGRCALCRLGLNGFDQVFSFGAYEGELRKLVHLFKFGGIEPLSGPLGRLLRKSIPTDEAFDAVVPMPLHWRRRWQRGFNQSELLAREIARRWNVPVLRAVRRTRPTQPQAGLTSAQRRKNVQGAFAPKRNVTLKGMRILLVDDVLTTGATASACARALKRAGALQVSLATIARRDRRAPLQDGSLT
jgi:ComF family protein